tara:strand:- start:410 stop:739 length:330 start_codon:yes stop_codon:yes gene_type:complete
MTTKNDAKQAVSTGTLGEVATMPAVVVANSIWPGPAYSRVLNVFDALDDADRPMTVREILDAMARVGRRQSDRTCRRVLILLFELGVVEISGDENRRLYQLTANIQSEG